ncbi:hypothetical protein D3C85_1094070 [compost metagenome]
MKVIGAATGSNGIAPMLHPAIAIIEFGAHHADAWTQQMGDHLFQPARTHDFGVVIEQADELTTGLAHGGIVNGRIVERMVIRNHPHPVFLGSMGQIGQGIGLIALVVHHQDLQIGIASPFHQAINTGLEMSHPITSGDDHRDAWQPGWQWPVPAADPVGSRGDRHARRYNLAGFGDETMVILTLVG